MGSTFRHSMKPNRTTWQYFSGTLANIYALQTHSTTLKGLRAKLFEPECYFFSIINPSTTSLDFLSKKCAIALFCVIVIKSVNHSLLGKLICII